MTTEIPLDERLLNQKPIIVAVEDHIPTGKLMMAEFAVTSLAETTDMRLFRTVDDAINYLDDGGRADLFVLDVVIHGSSTGTIEPFIKRIGEDETLRNKPMILHTVADNNDLIDYGLSEDVLRNQLGFEGSMHLMVKGNTEGLFPLVGSLLQNGDN